MEELYSVIYSPGEKYDSTKSFSEQNLKDHGLYMKQLLNENKLILAGPFKNNSGAQLILKVKDLLKAEEVATNDPAVINKTFNYKINIWIIRFGSCDIPNKRL